jgi:hypothetical protein
MSKRCQGTWPKDCRGSKKFSAPITRERSIVRQQNRAIFRLVSLGQAMSKKEVIIFSDGAGQDGGARADQRMSDFDRLYRA